MNEIFELKFYLLKVVSPRYPLKYRHNQVSYISSTLKVLKNISIQTSYPTYLVRFPNPLPKVRREPVLPYPIQSILSVQNRPHIYFFFITAFLYYIDGDGDLSDQNQFSSIFKGLHMERFDNKRNSQPWVHNISGGKFQILRRHSSSGWPAIRLCFFFRYVYNIQMYIYNCSLSGLAIARPAIMSTWDRCKQIRNS